MTSYRKNWFILQQSLSMDGREKTGEWHFDFSVEKRFQNLNFDNTPLPFVKFNFRPKLRKGTEMEAEMNKFISQVENELLDVSGTSGFTYPWQLAYTPDTNTTREIMSKVQKYLGSNSRGK